MAAGGGAPELPAPLADGFYVQPTVLADATNEMRVAQEEIFGPVAVVVPFDDEDDAVAKANDNRFASGPASGRATSPARTASPTGSPPAWSG